MPPFIPDVPYKVQAIFIGTFSYIWSTAFVDDYLDPMPPEGTKEYTDILRANTWRGIIGVVVFLCAFAFLNPYLDKIFHPYERWQRIIVQLTIIYTSFIIFLLHLRPETGRHLFGFLDPNLNKPVTKEMHTYDDHCELTLEHVWD